MKAGRQRSQRGEGSQPRLQKDGRWRAAVDDGWTPEGRRHRRVVYGATEAECKRKLRDLKREIYKSEQSVTLNPRMSVKAWADQWIEDYRQVARPTSFVTDEGMVRKWIVPNLGRRRLTQLSAADASKLTSAVRKGGLSDTSTRYVLQLLRRMLKAAKIAGLDVPEPILIARLPSKGHSSRSSLSLADATNLLEEADRRLGWDDKPQLPPLAYGQAKRLKGEEAAGRRALVARRKLWTLARDTDSSRWVAALLQGLRSGEARGLTWDRIDFDAGTITVDRQLQEFAADTVFPPGMRHEPVAGHYWFTDPKTEAGIRVIPMVPWMSAALLRWREVQARTPHGLVWPRANGEPMSKTDDLKAWKGLQIAAGVHKDDGSLFVLHEARHTTVSLLLAADVPPSVIIAIVGHFTFASTKPYSHTDLEAARAALMEAARAALMKVQDRLGLELES